MPEGPAPGDRRRLTIVSGAVLLAAAARFLRPVDYVDVWWHLAAGEAIWRGRAIPAADIFSATMRGRPWLNPEWLYETILYGLYSAGGLAAVVALKAALCTGIVWLTWRRLRLFAELWIWPLAMTALVFAGGQSLWHDRSELVSVLLLARLTLDLDGSSRRDFPRKLWLWPFLFCLWANVHGMFAVGLVAAGLWTAAACLTSPRTGRVWAIWLAACSASALINPYGPKLLENVFLWSARLDQSPVYEMLSTPRSLSIFWACALLLWASFAARWAMRRGLEAGPALVSAAFTYFGVRHLRGTPVFMIVAFPYFLDNLSRAGLLSAADGWARRRQGPLLAAALSALGLWFLPQARAMGWGTDVEKSFFAAGACDFLAERKVAGPYYNDYPLGSYWIWRFKGDPGAFIDGRAFNVEGYPELLEKILAAQRSPAQWNAFLDGYSVATALVRYPFASASKEPPLFGRYFPRDRWALVYWDDLDLIFLRRIPRNAEVIAREEFRDIEPDATLPYMAELIARSPERKPALLRELRRASTLHPGSRRVAEMLRLVSGG